MNVQRLKEYKAKLILFPVKASKPRKGDATKEVISSKFRNCWTYESNLPFVSLMAVTALRTFLH